MENELPVECCTMCLKGGITKGVIVSECLPVPVFGNHLHDRVEVATVALNPALTEFRDIGRWKPKELRLPMVADYGKRDRVSLEEDNVKDAQKRRQNYFCDKKRETHTYFEKLGALLHDVNRAWSYEAGNVVHCDLVACTTTVAWSFLSACVASKLVENCRQHFLNTLTRIPSGARILLNGAFVYRELSRQGVQLKLDGSPEPVCAKPPLTGWRGTFVLRPGKPQMFCAWSKPVGYLEPQAKKDLASWLQRHCL